MQDLHLLYILKKKSLNKFLIQSSFISIIISSILAIWVIKVIQVQIKMKNKPGFQIELQIT